MKSNTVIVGTLATFLALHPSGLLRGDNHIPVYQVYVEQVTGTRYPSTLTTQKIGEGISSVSTEASEVAARLSYEDGKSIEIKGKARFILKRIETNDSVVGELVYEIPKETIDETGKLNVNKPLNIQSRYFLPNIVAWTEKKPSCPVINFEFINITIIGSDYRFDFEKFILPLKESQHKAWPLLCSWASRISNGRSHARSLAPPINQLLKESRQN
jgi:hypothetical protein